MKTTLLSLALLLHVWSYGQSILYKQQNKVLEYNFGVLDSGGMDLLTESEKIMYELKYMEKRYSKTIYNNYEWKVELKIDSNEYEQDWMKLSKHFSYTANGIEIYDEKGYIIKTIPYTADELAERAEEKQDIIDNGYHPGIAVFPEFTAPTIARLATEGIIVETLINGDVRMKSPTQTTYFNKARRTIIDEFKDKENIQNRITEAYDLMPNNKGYLPRINKHERYVKSIKGPCITETKLVYYTDYQIEDPGLLIDKAVQPKESIVLFPNPNNGVFTVNVTFADNASISEARIINLLSGASTNLEIGSGSNGKTIEVNRPNLAPGNYAIQVIGSNQKTLTVNFIKN
jgi:hypothetical protein